MIEFLKNNRILIFILTLFSFGIGLVSLFTIPKEPTPSLNIPNYIMTVVYPGADPSTVEQQVIRKFENKLRSISYVKKVTSSSANSFGIISIEFLKQKKDVDAVNDIKSVIDQVYPTLSTDVKYPNFKKVDIADSPIYTFAIGSTVPTQKLYEKVKLLEDSLKGIQGVSDVVTIGKPVQQVSINIDYNKLNTYNLDVTNVINILKNNLFKYPADKKDVKGSLYSFEISNYQDNLNTITEKFSNLDLINVDGKSVKVKDISSIILTYSYSKNRSFLVTDNGTINTLSMQIKKIPGEDIQRITKEVKSKISAFTTENPGFTTVETSSMEEATNKMFGLFVESFFETAGLVFIIILIVFGLKSSVVILVSFLISYSITFGFLKTIGYTFNNIVSFSLILVLGIMIDNLIVITQGIIAGYKSGITNIWDAIKYSLKNYGSALTYGTLTTVAAFAPLYWMLSGIIGEFMKPFPITVNANLLFSILTSLVILPIVFTYFINVNKYLLVGILIPILSWSVIKYGLEINTLRIIIAVIIILELIVVFAYMMFGKRNDGSFKTPWISDKLDQFGEKLGHFFATLNKTKLRSFIVVVVFWVIFGFSIFLMAKGYIKSDFLPPADSDNIWINVKYKAGIAIDDNQKYTKEISDKLIGYVKNKYKKDVDNISIDLGSQRSANAVAGAFNAGSANYSISSITIRLIPGKLRNEKSYDITTDIQDYIMANIKGKYEYIDDIYALTEKGGPGAGKAVGFNIMGDNLDEIGKYVAKILPEVQKINGIYNIATSIEYSNGKVKYFIDDDKAKQLGINTNSAIFALIGLKNSEYEPNGIKIKGLNEFGDEEIEVKAFLNYTGNIEDLKIGKGYLNQIVNKVELKPDLKSLDKIDGKIAITIDADKRNEVPLGTVTEKIDKIIKENPLPKGLSYKPAGDIEDLQKSGQDLGMALLTGILLMYLILVALFKNLKYPTIIMTSIFLCIGGVFLILAITGLTFSFPAQLGIFGVLGVGVNQAIIHLIDFKEFHEIEGLNTIQSFTKSIGKRFEPIFLTKLTTIIGLLILAYKDEVFGSMAVAFIGGLLMSFFITLIYIPTVVRLFSKD